MIPECSLTTRDRPVFFKTKPQIVTLSKQGTQRAVSDAVIHSCLIL